MKTQPLISIITPVFNAEDFLNETVNSVQSQTNENWELILIDDGSTDNSLQIAKALSRADYRIKVVSIENAGAAVARNTGINLAKGDYLCFIDADDLWLPEKLEKQIEFMQKKNCAFSFTGYEFADATGKPNGKVVRTPSTINYHQALKNTTVFTSTVMLDMNKLTKEDVKMPMIKSEDTATWWKILKIIDMAYGLNETLTLYRRSKRTLSSNKLEAIRRIWNLYRNEKLNPLYSAFNFSIYAVNAAKRRI